MAKLSTGNPSTLGGRLRAFRERMHMLQTEMAEYLDVSASLYTKLEAGRTGTSLRKKSLR